MNTHHKEDFLIKKVKPFNVKEIKDVNDTLIALKDCGFQGKNLGIALDILEKMVSDKDIVTVLTISGAMIPAGMGELITLLMEKELIDVLISTGANIVHDLVDATCNIGHYLGDRNVSDDELFKFRINRIYDIFLPEDNYSIADKKLFE
ncbi:MAG: deoxyhypusine synthase family protein, partial [Promethearchaeota archaeon]